MKNLAKVLCLLTGLAFLATFSPIEASSTAATDTAFVQSTGTEGGGTVTWAPKSKGTEGGGFRVLKSKGTDTGGWRS